MNNQHIAAVILAAGSAARMGQPKQLLDWNARPLVRVAVEHALAATLGQVLVVVGSAGDAVAAALDGLPVQIVANSAFAEGQSTSLRAGIAALNNDVDAALVLLGDQPFVTPQIIGRIVAAWHASDAPIVAPVYNGQRGNPVLFARAVFSELLAIRGDRGARDVLAAHPQRIHSVAFNEAQPLIDIDTIEDYERFKQDANDGRHEIA